MSEASIALELLEQLTQAHGAPGNEGAVRSIFRSRLSGFPQLCDQLGCIAAQREHPVGAPVVLLAGHMDEVGFLIQNITSDGFLQFVPLGGWWSHTLPSQRVRILTRDAGEVLGVITSTPPHFLGEDAKGKVVPLEKLYIDVGARDRKQASEEFGISLGDTVVPEADFRRMRNPDLLLSKAFDNRVGMALAIQAMLALAGEPLPCRLAAVGTVQEELGTRGARTAGNKLKPDVVLVLEGPPADDTPGCPSGECQGRIGGGVQIRIMDPSALMNRQLVEHVRSVAQRRDIAHQLTVRRGGGTDAAAFQFSGDGTPVVVLGVPARYIHTHNSLISIQDYLSALRLIVEVVRGLDRKTVEGFTHF